MALVFVMSCCLGVSFADQQPEDYAESRSNRVFEFQMSDFSLANYEEAVENMLSLYEGISKKRFVPGIRRRVGLKVYSDSGPGLSTPEALVEAVVRSLVQRGFKRNEIFIIGLQARKLRESGFLPPLSHRSSFFNRVFVRSLDSGTYYHENWFYDSPLPSRSTEFWVDITADGELEAQRQESERRSLLPMPLMHEVDFWINLPCYSDHEVLGVNGALANATLWNASNTVRFLRSPATAPVAIAEMGAIPELYDTWALNIASLERFQYVGGPIFNSLYTVSEPVVMLSDNPVMMDAIVRERIDAHRYHNGFKPLESNLRLLEYAQQIGLGEYDLGLAQRINAN